MKEKEPVEENRWNVIEAVTRLFVATDNRDWPAVSSCFDESVLLTWAHC